MALSDDLGKGWGLDAEFLLQDLHMSNLLIHMPIDGTPESQACTEHVLPGIYTKAELERLVEFNKRKAPPAQRG